jgi:hypothetical protein
MISRAKQNPPLINGNLHASQDWASVRGSSPSIQPAAATSPIDPTASTGVVQPAGAAAAIQPTRPRLLRCCSTEPDAGKHDRRPLLQIPKETASIRLDRIVSSFFERFFMHVHL